MSWVITRHLLKCGGNNINWRIGNYNNYSSKQCQTLRKIYTYLPNSKRYKYFLKNINQSLYTDIDIYVSNKIIRPSTSCFTPPRAYLTNWCKNYSGKIADKIFRKCVLREDILTKYNNEGLKISVDNMFSICIANIINKYHSYQSFSNIEPDYYGWKPDLFKRCMRECSRRWSVELLD